jgi:hypothetical protein
MTDTLSDPNAYNADGLTPVQQAIVNCNLDDLREALKPRDVKPFLATRDGKALPDLYKELCKRDPANGAAIVAQVDRALQIFKRQADLRAAAGVPPEGAEIVPFPPKGKPLER